jgi:hypothetical protein
MGDNNRPHEPSPETATAAIGTTNDAHTNGRPPRGGAHDVPRIPGIPQDALHHGASHLYDPDKMRRIAVDVGRQLHAVEPSVLADGGTLANMYDAIGAIRQGAIVLPGQRDAIELLKRGRTARVDMAIEEALGRARWERVRRLVAENWAKLVEERDLARADVDAAAGHLEDAEIAFDDALAEVQRKRAERNGANTKDLPAPTTEPAPPDDRSIWEKVPISPKALAIVLPLELIATTLLLKGPISNLVITTETSESYFYAGAVSATLIGIGMIAGYGAAAMRLAGRLAGLLVVALSAWLVVRGVGELDLLRLEDERGVALFTTATVGTMVIAAVSSYSAVRYKAYYNRPQTTDVRAILEDVGVRLPVDDPLVVPLRKRDRAAAQLAKKQTVLEKAERALAEFAAMIDGLRTFAEETPVRVLGAQKIGVEAAADAVGVEARVKAGVAQELANTEATKEAARTAYAQIRAEERPDEDARHKTAGVGVMARDDAWPADGQRWRKRLAIAVLATGLVPGLILPSIPLAAGAALGAAGLWPFRRQRRARQQDGSTDRSPSIAPTTDEDHPFWRWLPSYTVAKYRRGGADSTERH